jgi:two-component system phosphate regulon sensor histidine kinase PhoR
MSSAQWSRRLFLSVFGLVAGSVTATALLFRTGVAASFSGGGMWLTAAFVIAIATLAAWYVARRMAKPLEELSRHIRLVAMSVGQPLAVSQARDDVSALAQTIDQMQLSLARRLADVQSQSQRLTSVLSNMAEGVLAAAPDTTVLLANDSARALLDFAAPNPVGRSLLEITRARPVSEALKQALDTADPVETEFESPGMPRRTLSLRAARLPGEPCPGVLIVLHDRTELRRLENLRHELVANVSHELKTPLAAIKGYAETLRLGAIHDTEHNLLFLHRIEEQADRLHELILNMLQIARLEAGHAAFDMVDRDVRSLLENCVQQFVATAAAKDVALAVELPDDELIVPSDAEALQTIVNNLIDNALKYTSSGGRVIVRASGTATTVAIQVDDTGIGIPEGELTRIFERFYRVDKARSRELGGTGLGLSIVKHLAQAHGGVVSVVSELGKGSTFRVELPRRQVAGKNRRPGVAAVTSD